MLAAMKDSVYENFPHIRACTRYGLQTRDQEPRRSQNYMVDDDIYLLETRNWKACKYDNDVPDYRPYNQYSNSRDLISSAEQLQESRPTSLYL